MSSATVPVPELEEPRPLDGDMLYEVVDGRIVEKAVSAKSVWIAFTVAKHLSVFADAHQLGRAVTELLFDINPPHKPQRRPDAAFVSSNRWPKRRAVPEPDAWKVVPDLAIEVISPSNRASDVLEKILEYFEAGVRLVWVIYPKQRLVQVYDSPTQIRVLRGVDSLDGAPVLPGFQLPLATLFEDDAVDED